MFALHSRQRVKRIYTYINIYGSRYIYLGCLLVCLLCIKPLQAVSLESSDLLSLYTGPFQDDRHIAEAAKDSGFQNKRSIRAQTPESRPQLQITEISVDQFPQIHVYLSGNNLGTELDTLSIQLEEDGLPKEIVETQIAEVGIQSVIVLDASPTLLDTGNTGEARLVEVANAVNSFVAMGLLSAQTDWLMAVTNAVTGSELAGNIQTENEQPILYQMIGDWQQDHQAIANALIQFELSNLPSTSSPTILSLETVGFAIEQFKRSPALQYAKRSIVLFSDGMNIASDVNIDNLIGQALNANVRVHTVLLGEASQEAQRNLSRLAEGTTGLYIELNKSTDIEPIWQTIAAERFHQRATYRLNKKQPLVLSAQVMLPDGQQLSARKAFPLVEALPVEIEIVAPAADIVFTRTSTSSEIVLKEMEPVVLPIQVDFQWPDGHPRGFKRVEYALNNTTQIVNQAPYNEYAFSVAELGAGPYTLRVSVVDELGISSTSPARSIQLQVSQPQNIKSTLQDGSVVGDRIGDQNAKIQDDSRIGEALASQAELWGIKLPTHIDLGGYTLQITPTALGVIAMMLSAILLVLSLYIASRKRNEPVSSIKPEEHFYREVVGAEHVAETEPSMSIFEMDELSTEPVRLPDFDAVAFLNLETEGTHLPLQFSLEEGEQIRIGRHSGYADLIIEDTRVSRRHCIIEWRNDFFYIRDEGSAGGTYVNRRRLGVGDERKLQHGDVINLNEIAYRFEEVDEDRHPTETVPTVKG
ncbi:MAG: FHA domain-containing protein [Chloroflexota bacterium]